VLSGVKKYVRCLTYHIQEITEYLKALDLLQIVYTENIPISNKRKNELFLLKAECVFVRPRYLYIL
jgi:hypothetical protein